MEKEFNLELCLWPPSSSASKPTFQFSAIPMIAMPFTLNHEQQIIVSHNGSLSLCDFTQLQARAILWSANQGKNSSKRWSNPEWLSLQMPKSENENGNGNAAYFSIKKSLKRFLQRRRTRRIQSMSPCHKL